MTQLKVQKCSVSWKCYEYYFKCKKASCCLKQYTKCDISRTNSVQSFTYSVWHFAYCLMSIEISNSHQRIIYFFNGRVNSQGVLVFIKLQSVAVREYVVSNIPNRHFEYIIWRNEMQSLLIWLNSNLPSLIKLFHCDP